MSLTRRIRGIPSPTRTAETDAGCTTTRWNRSMWAPPKWASAIRMGSAWENTATAVRGCAAAIRESSSSTRACTERSVSPPGNGWPDGSRMILRHCFVPTTCRIDRPLQSP